MFTRRTLYCAFILMLVPSIARSIDNSETTHSFYFRLMGLPPMGQKQVQHIDEGLDQSVYGIRFLSGDGETQIIDRIPLFSRSPRFRYEGTGPLTFFRQNADAQLPDKVLETLDIDPSWKEILILVLPDEVGAQNEFHTMVMSDDKNSFPPNSVRLINFAQNDLAWKVGQNLKLITKGKGLSVPINIDKPQMVPLKIAMLVPEDGEWRKIFSSALPFRGNSRYMCIVLPSPRDPLLPRIPPIIIQDIPQPLPETTPTEEEEILQSH
tara:strand:- start:18763 stop:19560 length:798 start_codon:yes stop_codon:yes gene_type:complete